MKAYGGINVKLHTFLTSAFDGGEWSASCSVALHPGKESLVPTGWETGKVANRKILVLYRESNSGHPACKRLISKMLFQC
jgi:hypothetical protein